MRRHDKGDPLLRDPEEAWSDWDSDSDGNGATSDLLNMVPEWSWHSVATPYRDQNAIEADLEERFREKSGAYPKASDFKTYRFYPSSDKTLPNAASFREHHRVHGKDPKEGTTLGNWVMNMRARYKNEKLTAAVKTSLSVVPEWHWEADRQRAPDTLSAKFSENAEAFRKYRQEHGEDPPRRDPLGRWVMNTRQRWKKLTVAERDVLTNMKEWRREARKGDE